MHPVSELVTGSTENAYDFKRMTNMIHGVVE